METERTAKVEILAREVFSQVGTSIVMKMRFLDMAVFKLKPVVSDFTLATDGIFLYYHPVWILKHYQEEPNAVARDYLHVMLHCIFSHPFINSAVNHRLWNLSCDIAVESVIADLNQSILSTKADVRRSSVIAELKAQVGELTAEKLYHYFQTENPLYSWDNLFRADVHDIWYSQRNNLSSQGGTQSDSSEQNDDNDESPDDCSSHNNAHEDDSNPDDDNNTESDEDSAESDDSDNDNNLEDDNNSDNSSDTKNNDDSDENNGSNSDSQNEKTGKTSFEWMNTFNNRSSTAAEWKKISEHIQMDLESFAKEQGYLAGSLSQALAAINREKYDYETFLKKFAVLGEVMRINDDEFDYIFYTYGLKLFGNMPLIEPLEYKEEKRIREFVIAIDTSGSTSGKLVNSFLTKTYNILQSTASFFAKVNIYIIQCDAKIQEVVQITKREDFEKYLRNMRLRGFGGTDFRPVFAYVDELVRQKAFTNLKGMVYFTDGYGKFPQHMPVYKTAFVFIRNNGFNNYNVPPWAIKLELDESDIK